MQVLRARVRGVIGGEVAEQDFYTCTPDEWRRARATNPDLSLWPTFLTPSGDVVAVEPIGAVLARLESHDRPASKRRKKSQ